VDRTAVSRALPAEVESTVPFDLDDMVLRHRMLDTGAGQSRSLAVVTPREVLVGMIDELAKAGAEPKVVVLDAELLSTYADQGVQVIMDVGHQRTLVCLCQAGLPLAARFVASGGAALTEAVAQAAGVELAEAEAWKHQATLPVAPWSGETVAAEWHEADRTDAGAGPAAGERATRALDVRAILIALEDEHHVDIDEILLAGGGSALGGLSERLAAHCGVPVRSVVVPGGHPPSCALAVALARVAAGEIGATDFRDGEFAFHGHADMLWNLLLYGTGGTVAAVAALLGMFALRVADTDARIAEIEGEIAVAVRQAAPELDEERARDPATAMAVMQERLADTTARVDALGAIVSGVPPTLDMLKSLSEGVPMATDARIDVRELTIADDAVSFKAETDSYDSAAKIEEALQRASRFSQAKRGEEKKVGEVLTFSINIPLGAPAGAPAEEEG
jgi:general secretion pathway protein L